MFVTGVVGPSQVNVTATMVLFDVVKAFTVGQDGFPAYKENLMGYIQLHSYVHTKAKNIHAHKYIQYNYIRTYVHLCTVHYTVLTYIQFYTNNYVYIRLGACMYNT